MGKGGGRCSVEQAVRLRGMGGAMAGAAERVCSIDRAALKKALGSAVPDSNVKWRQPLYKDG